MTSNEIFILVVFCALFGVMSVAYVRGQDAGKSSVKRRLTLERGRAVHDLIKLAE